MTETPNKTKKTLAIIGAAIGWFALITQLSINLNNAQLPLFQTLIKFFSYFTILTNLLVALYFSALVMPRANKFKTFFQAAGRLTAITGYILVVGVVYQVALRGIWHPQGMGIVADELLHTFIPAYTFSFWLLYEDKLKLRFSEIRAWMLYPLAYMLYSFVRGYFTDLYPYPFVDVTTLGYPTVLLNTSIILAFFVLLFVFFVGGSKLALKRQVNAR